MEWLTNAEDYLGRFGWGASGRMGISRMFTEQDKVTMGKENVVASLRPRGILSGFLAVVPTFGYAVYIPHISSKLRPFLLRMRLSDTLIQEGAIFSAYLTRDNTLIVEDAIVWGKQTVWTKHTFAERWMRYVKEFFQQFTPDRELQSGISIRPAEHTTLQALQEPSENQLIEFSPNTATTKRILWMRPMRPKPEEHTSAKPADHTSAKPAERTSAKPESAKPPSSDYRAKKETAIGPDVYSLWKGEERLGIALVRTLEISRALRLAKHPEIRVHAEWSKQFEKWEIKGVLQVE